MWDQVWMEIAALAEAKLCKSALLLPVDQTLVKQREAHEQVLRDQGNSEIDLYHPDVLRKYPELFSPRFFGKNSMSLAHLLLKRNSETSDAVEYIATSPDFSQDKTWQPVARIIISKVKRDYDFHPLNDWIGINLCDPKIFRLEESERRKIPNSAPQSYCGAWTGRIHAWATRLIEEGKFPLKYPS